MENDLVSKYISMTWFRKRNPNIIFTRADKDNVTVALDKNKSFLKKEMLN